MADEITKRRVVFDASGSITGKMRNEMVVRVTDPEEHSWEMASDEYAFHGGDGTAPLPIAYFVAGLASCLMTQIRVFAKRLRIDLKDLEVYCRCEWELTQKGRDPYVTAPVGFSFDIEIDSDAPREDIVRLIDVSKQACFIEQTLSRPNVIAHRLKTQDGWLDV